MPRTKATTGFFFATFCTERKTYSEGPAAPPGESISITSARMRLFSSIARSMRMYSVVRVAVADRAEELGDGDALRVDVQQALEHACPPWSFAWHSRPAAVAHPRVLQPTTSTDMILEWIPHRRRRLRARQTSSVIATTTRAKSTASSCTGGYRAPSATPSARRSSSTWRRRRSATSRSGRTACAMRASTPASRGRHCAYACSASSPTASARARCSRW